MVKSDAYIDYSLVLGMSKEQLGIQRAEYSERETIRRANFACKAMTIFFIFWPFQPVEAKRLAQATFLGDSCAN